MTPEATESDGYVYDFPGFLRTADGGYIKRESFVTFIAGAAPAGKAGTPDTDRAMAWLRQQGMKGELDRLPPAEVSRLIAAAQRAIAAKQGRERRAGPALQVPEPPAAPESHDEDPSEA